MVNLSSRCGCIEKLMFLTKLLSNIHSKVAVTIETTAIPKTNKGWTVIRVRTPLVEELSVEETTLVDGVGELLALVRAGVWRSTFCANPTLNVGGEFPSLTAPNCLQKKSASDASYNVGMYEIVHARVDVSQERRANLSGFLCTPGDHTGTSSISMLHDSVTLGDREFSTSKRQRNRKH